MSERPEDERLERAVDAARRDAELKATAEILALEQNLERERERAARSLEAVQRRLEETESRAVDEGRGTGAAAESADRGRQLLAGRDEAAAALREIQEQLARLERESQGERAGEEARRSERERALLEQSRAELEAQVRRELEGEFAQRISQIKSEADARVHLEKQPEGFAPKAGAKRR